MADKASRYARYKRDHDSVRAPDTADIDVLDRLKAAIRAGVKVSIVYDVVAEATLRKFMAKVLSFASYIYVDGDGDLLVLVELEFEGTDSDDDGIQPLYLNDEVSADAELSETKWAIEWPADAAGSSGRARATEPKAPEPKGSTPKPKASTPKPKAPARPEPKAPEPKGSAPKPKASTPKAPEPEAPTPARTDEKVGCSKCRWKGCAKCR